MPHVHVQVNRREDIKVTEAHLQALIAEAEALQSESELVDRHLDEVLAKLPRPRKGHIDSDSTAALETFVWFDCN
jgi:hypothetical protein